MSDTGSSWGTGAATLPSAGMEWETPPPPGATTPEPPPARPPRRSAAATVAVLVISAVIAFLVAGPLRSTVTTPAATLAPLSPATGSAAATPPVPAAPGSSGLTASDVGTVAAKLDKGVVDINTELGFQDGRAAGTGMVLTASGEILTNNHVIDGATKISVRVVDTGRTYTAHVVGTDPSDDVAIIQLENASGLKTITPARTTPSIGDPVVAVGNAGGRGGTPSIAAGTVVALGRTITATDENGGNAEQLTDLIEVDAPIEAGDSGGPLANRDASVIGMNSAAEASGPRFRAASGSGYAIPIDKALSIARQIESGRASSTIHIGLPAFLGVQIAPPAAVSGRGGGARTTLPTAAGALVAGIEPGTPAEAIGLAAGDTITSVNGRPVDSASALTGLLRTARPGDKAAIGWTDRAGTTHTAQATLATGPAD